MDAFDAERFWKLTAAYELDISYLRNTIQCHRISLLERTLTLPQTTRAVQHRLTLSKEIRREHATEAET